jgi:predicted nucleotidyltransferase
MSPVGAARAWWRAGAIIPAVIDLDAVLQILAARPDVRLAYLFGSAARPEGSAPRDVDVAVLFATVPEGRDLDRLASRLQEAARQRVDLVVLNTAPPVLAHEVIRGRLLVCRDDAERTAFEARTIARYLDTAHLRRVQHSYLRERARTYRARQT